MRAQLLHSVAWDLPIGATLFTGVLVATKLLRSALVAPARDWNSDWSYELLAASAVSAAVAWLAVALNGTPLRHRVTAIVCTSLFAVLVFDRAWVLHVHPVYAAMGPLGMLAARFPLLTFLAEVLPPAILCSLTAWLCRRSRRHLDLVLLSVSTTVAALAGVALYAPEVVQGYLQAAGVLPQTSPTHLAGVHVPPAWTHFWASVATIVPVVFFTFAEMSRSRGKRAPGQRL